MDNLLVNISTLPLLLIFAFILKKMKITKKEWAKPLSFVGFNNCVYFYNSSFDYFAVYSKIYNALVNIFRPVAVSYQRTVAGREYC